MSNLDLSELLVKLNIKDTTELYTWKKEKKVGKKDLANYILLQSSKKLDELQQISWCMEEATKVLDMRKTSRMEILRKAAEDCTQQCEECGFSVLMK